MADLVLCGAGNSEGVRLAQTIARASSRWERILLLDDDPAKHGQSLLGVTVAGPLSVLADVDAHTTEVVNLVTRTCPRRAAMRERIAAFGVPFATAIHPAVDVRGAEIRAGVTVYGGATVGPEVVLDEGAVVFMGAVIGHESHVGRGSVVAANAVLNARVRLGDRVYVGANASILPEVTVGADATIGLGSAVVHDVPPGSTALGVPAEVFNTGASRAADDAASGAAGDGAALRARLTDVWRDVLHVAHIGTDENFFDLGGTSLLAGAVVDRLRAVAGIDLHLIDIFRRPTIRSLADHLGGRHSSHGASSADEQRRLVRRQLHHHAVR
ncbi:MAG: phosphopantetheine-binding protein [Vicinamibacterales bacterium]